MEKCIGNFLLKGWISTPVEQAFMNGTFDKLLNESVGTDVEDIPKDFFRGTRFRYCYGRNKIGNR